MQKNIFAFIAKSNIKDVVHYYVELTKPTKARCVKTVNQSNTIGLFAFSNFLIFGKGLGTTAKFVARFGEGINPTDSHNIMTHRNKQPDDISYSIYY